MGSTYIKQLGEPDAPHDFSQPRVPALEHGELTGDHQKMPAPKVAQAESMFPFTTPADTVAVVEAPPVGVPTELPTVIQTSAQQDDTRPDGERKSK